MRRLLLLAVLALAFRGQAQDTLRARRDTVAVLPDVIVRNNLDYKKLLQRVKDDSSFYKAFRNLRVLGFSAYNDMRFYDKKHAALQAAYYSKTRQHRRNGCRRTEVLEKQVTGNLYEDDGSYRYKTAEMYASLFFANGTVCGEDNIVANRQISTKGKSGTVKNREQLKTLFFNPGKKIPGIPFIGDKLDLYDEQAAKLYTYRLDSGTCKGHQAYTFTIVPREGREDDVVVTEMVTVFDAANLDVLKRTYSLRYDAGVYDFDVHMDVELDRVNGLLVPRLLRYNGNWHVLFKKREVAELTATLFDFTTGE
jgi:hypothetical protein